MSSLLKVVFKSSNQFKFFKSTLKTCKKYNNSILSKTVITKRPYSNNSLIEETENNNYNKLLNNNSDKKFVNKYTQRTHTCGELSGKNVGQSVTLCGWLQFQRMDKFIVLRDAYGETQLILSDSIKDETVQSLPLESIIQINGRVVARPENMVNKRQTTGDIEVVVEKLDVLNRAEERLPFNIREFQKAKESLRMQYRYLDLRFPQMQRNLRARSELVMKMRQFLTANCFVDVETPTLFKATPGGAQEFIVPTRFPGQFYSLVQSPQQFKQTLMAGGVDRYFQIARCYRDEGSRPDRQPEFTQLDIELSFTCMDAVIELIEELLVYSWPSALPQRQFNRIKFCDAMEMYGSDQPDVRIDLKLKNCTEVFENCDKDFGAYALVFPKDFAFLTKKVKENFKILSTATDYAKVKFVQNKVASAKEFIEKCGKLLSDFQINENIFAEKLHIFNESIVFFAFGNKTETQKLLGKIRVEYANHLENMGISIRKPGMHFLWVYDFPLFESVDGKIQTVHHPFTAPHPDDLHLLETEPLKMRALAYDLVLNGNEVGGGSIRIHDPELQKIVLKLLHIDVKAMSHLIEMLSSGCPPHGGIALGLDRLLALMLNCNSIRDVIAFPKTFEGKDPLSGAPSAISEKEEQLYHIKSIVQSDSINK